LRNAKYSGIFLNLFPHRFRIQRLPG
jgi:hypothetical protein